MFMGDFWREAGLFAIPIFLVGAFSLLAAVLYNRTRQQRFFALAVGTTVATLLVGCMGTIMGFQMALRHLGTLAAEKRYLILIGAREAMNDMVLSLIFAFMATAILTCGIYRSRSVPKATDEVAPAEV